MDPDNARALFIRRWLLFSGCLEIGVGLGHNVLGSLIIVRPTLVAPVVAQLGWPMSILAPMPPEQNALVLCLSLVAGISWILFGAILVWQARARVAHPDVPLLTIVLAHQLSFCLLMLWLTPRLLPLAWIVGVAAAALGTAIANALQSSRMNPAVEV